MPKARNRWERVIQVLRWLKDEFKLPADLGFHAVSHLEDNDLGHLEEDEETGKLTIVLSAQMCRSVNEAVETAIHEAAHAKLYGQGLGRLHGPKFWTTYGRMMDAFDHHGHEDSRSYPTE